MGEQTLEDAVAEYRAARVELARVEASIQAAYEAYTAASIQAAYEAYTAACADASDVRKRECEAERRVVEAARRNG